MERVEHSFEDLQEDLMPVLHKYLAKRILLNRTWNNVRVITGKRTMKIIWFDAKNPTDHSKMRDVKPFNAHTLAHQVAVQHEKLLRDIKDAYG